MVDYVQVADFTEVILNFKVERQSVLEVNMFIDGGGQDRDINL